jgi:formamidopyrimidine-DNA glycosylase
MRILIIRHGDPDYEHDTLTEKGHREAKLLAEKLVKEIKIILQKSIEAGGTTFSDYRQLDGSTGKYVLQLNAYGRSGEKCRVCGQALQSIRQGGRTTVYCPICQK